MRLSHACRFLLSQFTINSTYNSMSISTRAVSTAPKRLYRQPASFYRGGTSNGIMISGDSLPQWQQIRSLYPDLSKLDLKHCARILEPVYGAIMGSPDPWGRQLNGMGGGLSSLSKAIIVDRPSGTNAMKANWDLDYLFIQIGSK